MSMFIAQTINKADPTTDIELMVYSLQNRLNQFFAITIALVISAWTGQWLGIVSAYLLLMLIRGRSGGRHLPSLTWCSLVSGIFMGLVPLINYNEKVIIVMTVVSVITFLLYAPNYFHERNDDGSDLKNKVIVTGIAASNLFIESSLMATILVVQAITIIPWSRR
ncbi:accessory gene regulator B family protein [Paenibacillus polysaccharolyticus]|uniref:accessory gene regulator B family protein n=1 Tax=Paenibacillus polysaccharolyticus TaxID=582692 RepID=UPI0020422E1A|nr:accessory gene regulator B family protein [Paenibacillus polysaccharolyticus]